jgi:hypothetical protein
MKKAEQIDLAKYINDYLYVQNCPHDAEHISNAIECFYDETYKETMLVKQSEADFELEQLMIDIESGQLGLYK